MTPAGHDAVASSLAAALRAAQEIGERGVLPRIHMEQAELYALRGDPAARQREIEQAIRRYREMGADPNAERLGGH